MNLDELKRPGCGDAADYFCASDTKYATTGLMVPSVGKSQTDQVAAALPPTTFGEIIENLDIVPRISQLSQDTSRPRRSHMRLGSRKPQSPECISSLPPGAESDSFQIQYVIPVEPVRFYQCILPPKLITI